MYNLFAVSALIRGNLEINPPPPSHNRRVTESNTKDLGQQILWEGRKQIITVPHLCCVRECAGHCSSRSRGFHAHSETVHSVFSRHSTQMRQAAGGRKATLSVASCLCSHGNRYQHGEIQIQKSKIQIVTRRVASVIICRPSSENCPPLHPPTPVMSRLIWRRSVCDTISSPELRSAARRRSRSCGSLCSVCVCCVVKQFGRGKQD